MAKKNIPVFKRGAPRKSDGEKYDFDGLTQEQKKQIREIANERNISIRAVKRQAIEWYLEAVETGRKAPVINSELAQTDKGGDEY